MPAFRGDHEIGDRARRARCGCELFQEAAALVDRRLCHRRAVLAPALERKSRHGPSRRGDRLLHPVAESVIRRQDQNRAGVGMGGEGPQHMGVKDLVGAHMTAPVGTGNQDGIGKRLGHAPCPRRVQPAHRQDHEVIADTRPAAVSREALKAAHRSPPSRLCRWT